MTMVTSPAWGMPAAPMLAAVAVMLRGVRGGTGTGGGLLLGLPAGVGALGHHTGTQTCHRREARGAGTALLGALGALWGCLGPE